MTIPVGETKYLVLDEADLGKNDRELARWCSQDEILGKAYAWLARGYFLTELETGPKLVWVQLNFDHLTAFLTQQLLSELDRQIVDQSDSFHYSDFEPDEIALFSGMLPALFALFN